MASRAANSLTLEIVDGITEHASRVALKGVFAAFGDVQACWVPPIDRRHVDNGSIRFATQEAADAAKSACDAGQVFFQGLPLKVKWRVGGGPRVGNSDIGGTVNNRSPTPERTKWRRGENNRPERARSPGREKRSRSRRKDGKRRRSPPPLIVKRGINVFRAEPDKEALKELEMQQMEMEAHQRLQKAQAGMLALPSGDPFGASLQTPDPEALAMAAAEAALKDEEDRKRKREAQERRALQMKRGPGVAALVQGALQKAQTLAKDKPKDDLEEIYPTDDRKRRDRSRDRDRRRRDRDATPERIAREERARKDHEEKEARDAQERKERSEREQRERREQAKRQAEAEAAERARREEETREQRIKAGIEEAKRQQAVRKKQDGDNLYGEMPEPDIEEAAAAAKRQAAVNTIDLSLPIEDRSKVVFLDIDGVLRPARAGGFDIVSVDGAQAVNPDTSDFFPSAMKALKHIIERTGAIIVLSSEWRRNDALRDAVDAKLTSHRLRTCAATTRTDLERELGTGDPVRSFAQRRAKEITSWLQSHEGQVKGWVVLDDINLSIADEDKSGQTKAMGPKLVQTWPLCGLTMGNAKTAVRILNGEMIHKVLVERPKAPGGLNSAAAAKGMATPVPGARG